MSSTIHQLSGRISYVEEEPGDGTRYSFLIVDLKGEELFPSSVYEIAVIPTKDDGATVCKPLYLTRMEIKEMGIVFDGLPKTTDSYQKCKAEATRIASYANDMNENPCTVAAAYRCAFRAMSLGGMK